jgi:hypothetical protein
VSTSWRGKLLSLRLIRFVAPTSMSLTSSIQTSNPNSGIPKTSTPRPRATAKLPARDPAYDRASQTSSFHETTSQVALCRPREDAQSRVALVDACKHLTSPSGSVTTVAPLRRGDASLFPSSPINIHPLPSSSYQRRTTTKTYSPQGTLCDSSNTFLCFCRISYE